MWRTLTRRQVSVLLLATCAIGCSSDDRLVELSEAAMKRQAEQNAQIAQQSQQVAEAAHELVQADAQAREELIAAQRSLEMELQTERSRLDVERDKLEQDRRALALAKAREPIIASTIWSAAILMAIVLPVLLCIHLIRTLGTGGPCQDLNELLVHELTSRQSMLLPPSGDLPRLERGTAEPADEPKA